MLNLCKKCGAYLSRTNIHGYCYKCKSKNKIQPKKPSKLDEKYGKDSWYRMVLEKQKGLPSLKEHLKIREKQYATN